MLTDEDRRAIEGLFDRLVEAERRAPQRDREAEALIASEITRQPAAPYYLAQTVIVQQQALEDASVRIEQLERQLRERQERGLFDGGRQSAADQQRDRRPSPWDRPQDVGYQRRGGGFLEGAAQTALGVAGGVLLGNAIGSLFGAGEAHAAEANSQDAGGDAANTGSDSDWIGSDGGDFDVGGDF